MSKKLPYFNIYNCVPQDHSCNEVVDILLLQRYGSANFHNLSFPDKEIHVRR